MRSCGILIATLLICCTVSLASCPKPAPDSGGAPGQPGGPQGASEAQSNGSDVSTAVGSAAKWPADWPAGLPQYPGSTLSSSHVGRDESQELMLGATLVSADSEDKVYKFYNDKAQAAGWKLRSTSEFEGLRADHYTSPDNMQAFNITCEPSDMGNMVSLMVVRNYMGEDEELETEGAGDGESGEAGAPGEDDSSGAVVDAGEEEPVKITTGKLPEGFPDQVLKPYPGGEIMSAMAQGDNYTLTVTTSDSVAQVTDFYLKHFTGRGWAKGDDIDMAGTRMIAFNSSAGEISFTVGDGGNERVISLVMSPKDGGSNSGGSASGGDGGPRGSAGGGSEASGGNTTITSGKLPDGWPANILPLYPGGKIDAAAINGNEYTLLQLSGDRDDQMVKHYDKLFSDAGWSKESSVTVTGVYYGGWNKDGDQIDMTARKREDGKAFLSLIYTDN